MLKLLLNPLVFNFKFPELRIKFIDSRLEL
jgi:hypothetical protein